MFYSVSMWQRDIFFDASRACPECIAETPRVGNGTAGWNTPDRSWSLQMSPASVIVCMAFLIVCGGVNAYRAAFVQRRAFAASKIRALRIEQQEKATLALTKKRQTSDVGLVAQQGEEAVLIGSRSSTPASSRPNTPINSPPDLNL